MNYWDKLHLNLSGLTARFDWSEGEVYSSGQLIDFVERIKSAFSGIHVNGRLIAVVSDSHIGQFCAILACGQAGGIPCPRLSSSHSEATAAFNSKFDYILEVKNFSVKISVGTSKLRVPEKYLVSGVAMGYCTSGSTGGKVKVVFQSHDQLIATEKNINERVAITPGGRELILTPNDNCYWFGRIRCCIAQHCSVAFAPSPLNPLKCLNILKKEKFSGLSTDTPLFSMLFDLDAKSGCVNLNRLLYIKLASAPLCPDRVKRFYGSEFKSSATIYFNYGLTEAMRCCILVLPRQIAKLGSVGKPINGVRMNILDESVTHVESNRAQQAKGEILTVGTHLSIGYDDDAEWSDRLVNGWFRTKDFGYIDRDGFVFIEGRMDDAININGQVIQPLLVEEFIKEKFGLDCYIVGWNKTPNSKATDKLVLVTESKKLNKTQFDSLKYSLQVAFGSRFVPERHIQVTSIPRTGNGKVKRLALKHRVQDRENRR